MKRNSFVIETPTQAFVIVGMLGSCDEFGSIFMTFRGVVREPLNKFYMSGTIAVLK